MSFWSQSNHPVEIKTPEDVAEGIELLEAALEQLTTGLLKAEEMNREEPPSPKKKTDLIRSPHVRMVTTFTEPPQDLLDINEAQSHGELGHKWEGHSLKLFAKSGDLSKMLGDCKPQTLYRRTQGKIDGEGETYRTAWRPSFHEQVQRDICTAVEYLAPICEANGWSADAFDRLIAWDRESEQKSAEIRDAYLLIAKLRRKHGVTGGLYLAQGKSKANDDGGNGAKQKPYNFSRLKDRHFNALQAMIDLKATDRDGRKTAQEIAVAADGRGTDAESYKRELADLVLWGLAGSEQGRKGGSWITREGKAALKQFKQAGKKPRTESASR